MLCVTYYWEPYTLILIKEIDRWSQSTHIYTPFSRQDWVRRLLSSSFGLSMCIISRQVSKLFISSLTLSHLLFLERHVVPFVYFAWPRQHHLYIFDVSKLSQSTLHHKAGCFQSQRFYKLGTFFPFSVFFRFSCIDNDTIKCKTPMTVLSLSIKCRQSA